MLFKKKTNSKIYMVGNIKFHGQGKIWGEKNQDNHLWA